MLLIPKAVYAQYMNHLKRNGIAADQHQTYVKWLRYFLDFCARHVIAHDKMERLRLFAEKLRKKKQGMSNVDRLPMP
jgi:ribosomal protein L16/L10AE